ncbi:MAG: hypothetical protein V1790_10165 [Planctomycetota bacterium]
MALHMPNKSRRRRRKVAGWAVLLLGLQLIGAGVLAYRHYADPERVRAEAEALLQQFALGRVRVGSAAFSILDGIRLFDVVVAGAPGEERLMPDDADRVFSCREVLLTHDPLSALWGQLRIRSVVAIEPTCLIVHDSTLGTTNIAGLFQGTPKVSDLDAALPTIELRDARIRVVYRGADRDRTVEDLGLTIRGRPAQQNPGLYDLVWQSDSDPAAGGYSQIDLHNGYLRNVRGGLPSLSIETVMLAVEARYDGAGAWCDLLGLDGRVRARDYNLIGGARGVGGSVARSATIDLHDASLSIPIQEEERGLTHDQRYLRFEHVDGMVEVTADAIRAEFSGRFHGSACQVSATMRGRVERLATLDDVDFDAQLTVTDLELPRDDEPAPAEQVRFIRRFGQLEKFFRDYDPHGTVDLQVAAAKRAGAEEPIAVRRVLVTARGGDASARYFPYRGLHLSGAVEYRPDGVWIRHVCGEHDGGVVCVDGRLERPDACAAAEITINGVGLPIDDQLDRGLTPRYRAIKDRLRPQGRLNADIALSRPACRGGEPELYRSRTTVRFDDLSASYVEFPYAVDHLSGELRVRDDRLEIVGVEGRAGDARVRVSGHVALGAAESADAEVMIVAEGAKFDSTLIAALPENIRTSVAALHPSGPFDLETTVTVDPQTGRTAPRSTVTLRGASVRPDGFPVEITDLEGRVRVDAGAIVVDGVVGRYRDGIVTASGAFALNEAGTVELAVGCRNLRIDDELRAAAPPKLRAVLTDWQVDGPIRADIAVRRDPTRDNALSYSTTAELDGVAVRHPRFPAAFEDVHGTMTVGEGGSRGIGFRGRYAGADVQVDFDTRETEDGEEGTIVLSATDLPLDGNVRGLLPERLRGGWDRAGLRGRVDVRCNELHYRQSQAAPYPTWSVDGRIDLHHVDAPGLAELEDLSGTLSGSGTLVDRLGGATLSGRLQLASGRVYARTLSDIESAWSLVRSADGVGRLAIDDTQAAIYEGALTGQAELLVGPDRADYNLSATVHGMQIAPWLRAGRTPEAAPPATAGEDAPDEVRGLADAHLYLTGVVGEPLSRRGGGRLEVRDGFIYRLPILLAILNVLDISVPNDDALHELEAEFFILGNRLNLTDIALRGRSLTLVGEGSMSLPDQAVDLRLVNIGTRSWARLPILADLVEGAARGFVELRVTGPVSRPTVRAQPLRALSDELKRLFQKKLPKKIARAGS